MRHCRSSLTDAFAFIVIERSSYGFQCLYEAYLYHFTRTDNRHNFSVYFYDLYLRYNTSSGFGVGILAFLPQLTSLVAISFACGRDLPFALFALTMVFVIFNKVCTAQVRNSLFVQCEEHRIYWVVVCFSIVLLVVHRLPTSRFPADKPTTQVEGRGYDCCVAGR